VSVPRTLGADTSGKPAEASIRRVLPLALVTCTGMLAMDLYLPAVPSLQEALAVGVELAQATVAVFLVGLAASQLLWAEALGRIGPRRSILVGITLLVAGSAGCALASGIETLLLMRLVQGLGAGAATVIAPTVVRATLTGADAVRGMAAIAMIESIVPAVGPVLGALLLPQIGWRGVFWTLSATAVAVLPFVARVTPPQLPGLDRTVDASFRRILRDGRYVRLAASHALSVGALLTFVASAPQLVLHALGLPPSGFAVLQVLSVATFALMATQAGRISGRIGAARSVQVGAWAQATLCAALLAVTAIGQLSFVALVVFWCGFCGALAVRGPSAFMEALTVPAAQMGRASAMLVLGILLAGALGTQLVAPAMEGRSGVELAAAMLAIAGASLLLVARYPHARATAELRPASAAEAPLP
jgi:DHA1 family bicyclomycin/chloramphenicol resistance-like MFS transporter